MRISCSSSVAPLRTVLVKDPACAWFDQKQIDKDWRALGYLSRPEFSGAVREHAAFCALLEDLGASVLRLPSSPGSGLDSVYVHDPCTAGPDAMVLGRMGKPTRQNEPAAVEAYFRAERLPVAGQVEAPGTFEGGDLIWMDASTVAIGIGYRTNLEGARQVGQLLGVDVIEVPLPHWNGPDDVMHLMSLISPLDDDLALVYPRLLPVSFVRELTARSIESVLVSDAEFETLGCNVLAVAPRVAVMVEGNPGSAAGMRARGVTVHECAGTHMARAGQGGPTCLTRPLVRG